MKRAEMTIGNGAVLDGKRIAVTRAQEQSSGLVEKLRSLGAEVVECPAIAIAPLEDYSLLDEAIRDLPHYDWVIFTSVNGVDAFVERLSKLSRDLTALAGRKVAAIGPATAHALERAGREPDFMPDSYVAEAIIEQIGDVRGCRILLPRADIARKALADGLQQRGATVTEVAVYRTVPGAGNGALAALLEACRVDAITFTSSSTVRYTLEGLEETGISEHEAVNLVNRTAIVCIGPITAATAREYRLEVAKVADEYTQGGLVAALAELFSGVVEGEKNA